MSTRSATASVEVHIDPTAAFTAFTDEIDSWWVRGPINFFDAARAAQMRIEPGVGGRVLEVYTDADALELARVTVWEPGARLVYRSSVDDTETEVRFDPTGAGTRVTVRQYLLEGGERAFLFWPRIIKMFVPWCAERDRASRGPREMSRLHVGLYYEDPHEAARWLHRVFGLDSWKIPEEGDTFEWVDLHVGDVPILLFRSPKPPSTSDTADNVTHEIWVHVDDLDRHHAHARANGARIVSEITQHGYRAYVAEDLAGHRWTFAQARPTMR